MKHREIDRASLKQQARRASESARAPYSGFRVGAVVVDGSGAIHAGCNVENASFGLTSCAERNALAAAILAGASELQAIVIYTPGEQPWSPCGACRQVMSELMPEHAVVLSGCDSGADREWTVSALLPDAFQLLGGCRTAKAPANQRVVVTEPAR